MNESVDTLLLDLMRQNPSLSDLNFTPDKPVQAEIDGELRQLTCERLSNPLTAADTETLARAILAEESHLASELEESGSCDLALALSNGARLRVNIFRSRGRHSLVLRILKGEIQTFRDLALPPTLEAMANLVNGLVLVTGATGSGKSTTLAAVIDLLNSTRSVHVVTLEDPIEFLHPQKQATINQRELGLDFPDFTTGLRAALRQAPKVILVGEIRDRDTLDIAIKASETGHLVLSTLHTVDAGQTIERLAGMFEARERDLVRSRLAQVLRFVVSQRLLPKKHGGRVAALEIMGSNLRTRELILSGETPERTFYTTIADAKPHGWQTFDQHLIELLSEGVITEETALTYASRRSVLARAIDDLKTERGEIDPAEFGALEMENPQLGKRR